MKCNRTYTITITNCQLSGPELCVGVRLGHSIGVTTTTCDAIKEGIRDLQKEVRGMSLPINVDGVIDSIIADMGFDPKLAKALFILGRVCGLSAHYFSVIFLKVNLDNIL